MNNRPIPEEEFFEQLAAGVPLPPNRSGAPPRLKSRIYSMLALRQAATGPLASFDQSKQTGYGLCVFEELVRIAPVGQAAKSSNICRVCHARVLAEHLEKAPIYWPNCPYVRFQKP